MAVINFFDNCTRVAAVLTNRTGGISSPPFGPFNLAGHVGDDPNSVAKNREILAYTLDLPLRNFVYMEQVHGNKVEVLHNLPARLPICDAMVTNVPNLVLMVLVADCVPLVFASDRGGVVGVAHAGWRGTTSCISTIVVDEMIKGFNLRPDEIKVIIGPSIGKCCYGVGEEVLEKVYANIPYPEKCITEQNGMFFLDLREANKQLLLNSGILENQITVVDECTKCNTRNYFSYRGEQGITGRFGMGAWVIA